MTLDELKSRCISSGRSLQWILSVISQEEVMMRIAASPLRDNTIIKGAYILQSLGASKSQLLPKLEMAVCPGPGMDPAKEILEAKEQEITLSGIKKIGNTNDPSEELYLVSSLFHGISASFYMKTCHFDSIESLNRSIYGASTDREKKEIRRLSGDERPIPLLYMCPEGIFIERYREVLTGGELIDSMETWYDMFYIATNYSLKGHRIGELMGMIPGEDEMLSMKSLSGNKSLGDRWRAFAREHKIPLKGFPDLAEFLLSVVEPVEGAARSGEEFFGQWMPELCRYID